MSEAHEGNEKMEQQTESIRVYEKFADSEQYNNAIDTNIWSNTDSDANHTSVVVTASERLEQDGDTTAGSTFIRTNRKFSRNVVIEADLITTTLTEGASGGEVYPSIRLYTSANEWVRWGPYKENAGQDSRGFIKFSDKGDVDQEVDVNAANTDAVKRKYTIMVLEDKLVFSIDDVYQFEMSMVGLHDFYVDLITSTTQADNAYADIFWSEFRVKNINQASLDIVQETLDTVEGLLGITNSGRCQTVTTTIDLDQAAGPYVLWTGTGQSVILESLVFECADAVAAGALTSIEIETDHTTNQTIIDNVIGAVANLTAENQLAAGPMEGPWLIPAGNVIRLNIAGGATGAGYVCTVVAKYRSVVDGGTLA